ncbi:MAG TPA: LysR family transcriptional regulator [Bryobacteraceae bacterium]|jgi:DNA-binding transcriptional LysR family regulator|nr:LysR family transcriptional regulator [Bryobacteraceae bacterium]
MLELVGFWELKLFREIVATRSMSKGAAHCGVSQSAASQHVQEVERRLGITLLDRTRRPLELTPAGKAYNDFCRDVLRREEELTLELEPLKRQVEGTLRVASIYSIGLSDMSCLQDEFTTRYPTVQLQVEYMHPEKVYEAVLNDTADLGLVSYPQARRDIAVIPWRDEEMHVAVPLTHAFAQRREVHPADLNGQTFIGFDEDLTIRRELDRFFRAQGVEINLAMHFDNIQTIKEAVALGSGISILPARTMQAEIAQGRLVAVKLHAPGLVRPVGVVHRKRKKFSRAAQSFIELLTAPVIEPEPVAV